MIRIRSFGAAAAILVMQLAAFGFSSPQADVSPPLTCDQVKGFFKAEKSGQFAPGYTRARIEQVGVDFEPDSACGLELIQAEPGLREPIRRNAKITTLTIQCEPVECDVTINNEVAGTTVATILTKSHVKHGLVTIKVTAPGFETQTREVPVSPGEHLRVQPKFTMEPVKGGLAVTCELELVSDPAVCEITIKGNGVAKKGETTQGRLTVKDLPSGKYEVEARAPLYKPKTDTVWIVAPDVPELSMKLTDDPWERMTPLQVFDHVTGSLGGKDILTVGDVSKNTARMRLAGDPPSIGMWNSVQVDEIQARNRLRWDLVISGTKWQVFFDGTKVISKGDKQYSGKEFAQELEHSIRLFSAMKLPLVLSLIREKFDIKKGLELTMIAESLDERFTFQLNADYSPFKVLHERLTAPRSREEMEFGQYKPIGQDLKLPHVLILRYPDRPKHEHIFEYDKIDTGARAQIKEAQFKP